MGPSTLRLGLPALGAHAEHDAADGRHQQDDRGDLEGEELIRQKSFPISAGLKARATPPRPRARRRPSGRAPPSFCQRAHPRRRRPRAAASAAAPAHGVGTAAEVRDDEQEHDHTAPRRRAPVRPRELGRCEQVQHGERGQVPISASAGVEGVRQADHQHAGAEPPPPPATPPTRESCSRVGLVRRHGRVVELRSGDRHA